MSCREKIPFQASRPILLVAPTDVRNQNPLDNTNDGATCSFKVYDAGKDEAISVDEAIGQDVLSVTNAGVFEVGDIVEVTMDDDVIHESPINAVDVVAGTIQVDDILTVSASAGQRVRVLLGTEITMIEYGTPKIGKRDWGFEGVLESDHPDLEVEQDIDVVITFVGSVSGGLDVTKLLEFTLKPPTECNF